MTDRWKIHALAALGMVLLLQTPAAAADWDADGHGGISFRGTVGAGMDQVLARVVALGSIAPDYFEFPNPAAHFQPEDPPTDAFGVPQWTDAYRKQLEQDREKAKEWHRIYYEAAVEAAKNGETERAAFYLGYALHNVQDAMTHQFMSNFEHVFRERFVRNPDTTPDRLIAAMNATSEELERFRKDIGKANWKQFQEPRSADLKMGQDRRLLDWNPVTTDLKGFDYKKRLFDRLLRQLEDPMMAYLLDLRKQLTDRGLPVPSGRPPVRPHGDFGYWYSLIGEFEIGEHLKLVRILYRPEGSDALADFFDQLWQNSNGPPLLPFGSTQVIKDELDSDPRYGWVLGDKDGNLSPDDQAAIAAHPENYRREGNSWYYFPAPGSRPNVLQILRSTSGARRGGAGSRGGNSGSSSSSGGSGNTSGSSSGNGSSSSSTTGGPGQQSAGSGGNGPRVVTMDAGPKPGGDPAVGGIRLRHDPAVLLKALRARSPAETTALFRSLGNRLEKDQSAAGRHSAFQAFARQLNAQHKAGKELLPTDELVIVSLRSLLDRAEALKGQGQPRPPELRFPGRLGRIHGFVLRPEQGDICLLGASDPQGPGMDLDDLIVAARTVWRDGGSPTCSLDPDPDDFAAGRAGPQKVRLIDVPGDSSFARGLLDADYAMKRVQFGTEPVRAEGFTSLKDILKKDPAQAASLQSRCWFCLVPFQPGDIQVAEDGRIALFHTRIQALTEQMTLTRDGMVGKGQVDPAAELATASLTRHYRALAREQVHFRRLEALADLVTLCRLWREMRVPAPLLQRLCDLSYQPVQVPESYPGIKETIVADGDKQMRLFGGVQLKASAGPRAWLVLDDEELQALRKKVGGLDLAGRVDAALPGVRPRLPLPALPANRADSQPGRALQRLMREDYAAALVEADKAVAAQPEEALPLAIRAIVHLSQGHISLAQADALKAQQLDPANSAAAPLVMCVLRDSLTLLREGGVTSDPEVGVIVPPESKEAALLRGSFLLLLGNGPAARQELQKAIALDPGYARAHARLGLLEANRGFRSQAKKHALKARELDQGLSEATATLALSELLLRHLTAADALAREVLDRPDADLDARVMALNVLVGVAAKRGDWRAAKEAVHRAEGSLPLPALVPVWLFAVEQACEGGEREMASTCLARSERFAPSYPGVGEARRRFQQMKWPAASPALAIENPSASPEGSAASTEGPGGRIPWSWLAIYGVAGTVVLVVAVWWRRRCTRRGSAR